MEVTAAAERAGHLCSRPRWRFFISLFARSRQWNNRKHGPSAAAVCSSRLLAAPRGSSRLLVAPRSSSRLLVAPSLRLLASRCLLTRCCCDQEPFCPLWLFATKTIGVRGVSVCFRKSKLWDDIVGRKPVSPTLKLTTLNRHFVVTETALRRICAASFTFSSLGKTC